MLKKLPLALAISSSITLSACLEVEDNNDNADVVAALEAQNEILKQQNSQQNGSVTLSGNVIDLVSGEAISGAVLRYKIGNTWSEAKTLESNTFDITELSGNTDYLIELSSTDGSFLTRAFNGTTKSTTAGQVSNQQLNSLYVTKPEMISIELLNEFTNKPIENMELSYENSYVFNASQYGKEHKVFATFNSTTGKYELVVPQGVAGYVNFETDIDNDGIKDFDLTNLNYYSEPSFNYLKQHSLVYAKSKHVSADFEIRVNVINEVGTAFTDLSFFSSNAKGENVEAQFDSATQQYVFNFSGSASLDLNLASFQSSDSVTFSSARIQVQPQDEGISVSTYNFKSAPSGIINLEDNVLNLTVIPNAKVTYNDPVQLLNSKIDGTDHSLNLFFDSAVDVISNEIKLVKHNVLSIVRGNDSSDDLVPDGTTTIGYITQEQPLSIVNKFSNTFIDSTPQNELTPGNYTYKVGNLLNIETAKPFDLNRNYSFEVNQTLSAVTDFDINDVKLDNNNGSYQGALTVSHNTAGISSPQAQSYNRAALYFPQSIESLAYFKLSLVKTVNNGSETEVYEDYTIVEGDSVKVSSVMAISVALNENIEKDYSPSTVLYTNLDDGWWYSRSDYSFPRQDYVTNTDINSATFNYLYQVKGIDSVVSGTIELNVD